MSRRKYRDAATAKRVIPDIDLSEYELALMDRLYAESKTAPVAAAAREHQQLAEQQQMLGILRGAV